MLSSLAIRRSFLSLVKKKNERETFNVLAELERLNTAVSPTFQLRASLRAIMFSSRARVLRHSVSIVLLRGIFSYWFRELAVADIGGNRAAGEIRGCTTGPITLSISGGSWIGGSGDSQSESVELFLEQFFFLIRT